MRIPSEAPLKQKTKTRTPSHSVAWGAKAEERREHRSSRPSVDRKSRGRRRKPDGHAKDQMARLSTMSAKSATPSAAAASNGVPAIVPEFLPNVINCEREEDPVITQFADREKIALISFIAPQVSVRISPADAVSASIGLLDEFG